MADPVDITSTVANTLAEFVRTADDWANNVEGTPIEPVLGEFAPIVSEADASGVDTTPDHFDEPASIRDAVDAILEDVSELGIPKEATADNITAYGPPAFTGDTNIGFGDFVPGAVEPKDLVTIDWGTAPTVEVPELRDAPGVVDPDDPNIGNYLIPTFGGLSLPTITSVVPPSNLPAINPRITYESVEKELTAANAALVDALAVMSGRLSVQSHVWNAIWGRIADQQAYQAIALEREASTRDAANGWDLPGGYEKRSVARQEIHRAINTKLLESGVTQAQMQREDYWKAIESIVACSRLILEQHNAHQERLLKTAVAVSEAEINFYNACVNGMAVLLKIVDEELAIAKVQIDKEVVKLEEFKAKLVGVNSEIEADKNKIAIYTALWEGQKTKVQSYAAWADGVKSIVEAGKANVEAYGESVKAKLGIVQAWDIEWNAYTKKLEKSKLQIEAYNAQTNLFGQNTALYGRRIENALATSNISVEQAKLKLQASGTNVEQYKSVWAGVESKVRALTSTFATEGQIFAALSQASLGEIQNRIENYKARLQAHAIKSQAAAENLKTAAAFYQTYQQNAAGWNNALFGAYSQMASSALTAGHIQLGSSSSFGNDFNHSYSEQLSHGYSVSVQVPVDSGASVDITPPI